MYFCLVLVLLVLVNDSWGDDSSGENPTDIKQKIQAILGL